MLYFIQQQEIRIANKPEIPDEVERMIDMFQTTKFEIVKSEWPNVNGEYYWTISDGVNEKGEFSSRKEAEDNMERIMLNWRADS